MTATTALVVPLLSSPEKKEPNESSTRSAGSYFVEPSSLGANRRSSRQPNRKPNVLSSVREWWTG
jgi:hypothetical protein